LSGTQTTSPMKNGKPLSPSSTNWNPIHRMPTKKWSSRNP